MKSIRKKSIREGFDQLKEKRAANDLEYRQAA